MRDLADAVKETHFPVGKSDFASIRRSGQFFADNSAHIRTVEDIGKQLMFTRPPRWGKSLFVDMMCVYYDKNTSESDFMKLFGGLDIGKSPTAEARSFCVLPIDLTVSVHAEMPVDVIRECLYKRINGQVENFAKRYTCTACPSTRWSILSTPHSHCAMSRTTSAVKATSCTS
jgi:hypothetical protein